MTPAERMTRPVMRNSTTIALVALAAASLGWHARAQEPRPGASTALLGRSTDAALDVFGPPTRSRHGEDDVRVLVWTSDDGPARESTVCADVVVYVTPVETLPSPTDDRSQQWPHLGQSVKELVLRRGNADRQAWIPVSSTPGGRRDVVRRDFALVYGDLWVTVAAGRVVAIGPGPVDRARGPR